MWSTAKHWLLRTWWGIGITYLATVLLIYLFTWTLIEPLSIPDKIPGAIDLLLRRSVFHILFALMVGCHITLVIESLRRRSMWRQTSAVKTQIPHNTPSEILTSEASDETKPLTNMANGNAHLTNLEARLESYESLEKEIIGVLASGVEITLGNLSSHLSLSSTADSARKIRLAVANLLEMGRIEGTGGLVPSIRLVARQNKSEEVVSQYSRKTGE